MPLADACRMISPKLPPPLDQAGDLDPFGFPDLYALKITGNCMDPVLQDGSTVAFDRVAPVRVGDVVAIWLRPALLRPGGAPALVKRLTKPLPVPAQAIPVSGLDFLVSLESVNPARRYGFRASDIRAIHRCLGPVTRSETGAALLSASAIQAVRQAR